MKMNRILFYLPLLFSAMLAFESFALENDYWAYCSGPKAFRNAALTQPSPSEDWICVLPTAQETKEDVEMNTLRCLNQQKANCEIGAGGDAAARGGHNVGRDAWYWMEGSNATGIYPDVRCQCGCFTGDVEVLTQFGPRRLDEISKNATRLGGVSVVVLDGPLGTFKGSQRLLNRDFVVGPEEKPIVFVGTAGGRKLTLTDSHPVLVQKDSDWQMIRSEDIVYGDTLMTSDGKEDRVVEIASYDLPETSRLVYNFDTKGRTDYEHVIVANALRVGDLHWQNRLSEQENRAANILKFAQQ